MYHGKVCLRNFRSTKLKLLINFYDMESKVLI
jgi:hypothetical protein